MLVLDVAAVQELQQLLSHYPLHHVDAVVIVDSVKTQQMSFHLNRLGMLSVDSMTSYCYWSLGQEVAVVVRGIVQLLMHLIYFVVVGVQFEEVRSINVGLDVVYHHLRLDSKSHQHLNFSELVHLAFVVL